MKRSITTLLTSIILGTGFFIASQFAVAQTPAPRAVSPAAKQAPAKDNVTPMGHRDHNPKHGGTFFMAMDNKHHLEGTLVAPGKFVLYLYDDHTKPLLPAKIKATSGDVAWGEDDNAPKSPLALSKDGKSLEASFPGTLKLPVTAVLRVRLDGVPATARPELFTFPFSHFTADAPSKAAPGGMDHSMHNMSGHDMDNM
jgi:hypothetical protein